MDPGNLSAGEVLIKIPEMGPQLFEGLPLCPIMGEIFHIAEPLPLVFANRYSGAIPCQSFIASVAWLAKRWEIIGQPGLA